MKFLIVTEPDDMHAIMVRLALEHMGHEVTSLFTADQPTRLKYAVYIDQHCYLWKGSDPDESYIENKYDVVWWRRARAPHIPKADVHADDLAFVRRENKLFFESLTHTFAPEAWWVNPKEAAQRANFKLLQLRVAQACGLTVPMTLCTNDPKEIHHFLLMHEAQGVIYKPLSIHFWFEQSQIKTVYTARVNFLDLPTNNVLQRTPGLFQQEIRKQYELRVTCFGDYLVAARLDSQAHVDGEVDWRAIRKGRLSVEPYELPDRIAHGIRMLMRRLGLVFGALDFIVTPEGEYVFLEVNEQGQFLWIEEFNPTFHLLNVFVHFLVNQSVNISTMSLTPEHTMADYRDEAEIIYVQNKERHVVLNDIPVPV